MTKTNLNIDISGKSVVLGVIGDPIKHTFSPQIHNSLARALGLDTVYVPFHVENNEAALKAAINGAHSLGIKGINVTIPHKRNVMKYLAGIDKQAEIAGAVNTLKYTPDGYIGYNTDIRGIIDTFKRHGYSPSGKKAAVIGAGGTAYAAVCALIEMNAAEITVINRTLENAEELAAAIKKTTGADICAALPGDVPAAQAFIQTSSVGFGELEGKSPISFEREPFKNAEFVFDVIYTPWTTAFLKEAKKYCKTANGFDMLFYQAAAAYEIFMDITIDEQTASSLRDELEAIVI